MQSQNSRCAAGTRHDSRLARVLATTTFFLLAIAIASWPRHAAAQGIAATATYSCDFSTGYCDLGEQSKLGDAPPSTERRSSIVATSRGMSLRLHTEPGDDQVHGSGTWERDDLTKPADPAYCNEGQEEWWAMSVMFPSDYVYPPGPDGGVVMDFHHDSSSGLPNFSVDTMPGGLGMRIRGQGGATINGGQYTSWFTDPYGAVGDVTRNQWYDFVFHIKWSSTSAGFSEAWLNGKKIHSFSGPTLYQGISCYLKLANYHGPFGQPSSIVFNRVVRGTSATDVALGPLEGLDATPVAVGSSSGGTSGGSTTPSTGGSAILPVSATMDSSSYTIAQGASVTFTARMLGNSATPTGSVAFRSDGAAISACGGVALAGGVATCTTSSLPAGTHAITGVYSGDATYAAAQAGPITQTVAGVATATASLPTSFGMDSSSYTSSVGQAVTFTATVPGAGGTAGFQDNGATIAGCATALVSDGGVATCTVATLVAGAHAIRAIYTGNGSYGAGVAGPITQTVLAASAATVPVALGAAVNVQGLWWGSSTGAESGWGVNLAQQGDKLFATWFTYDASGNGLWLVMPDSARTAANTYGGTLYRTTGPAFGPSFDASKITATAVGMASFSFADGNNGTFSATVDGVTVTKAITRQVYGQLPTCTEGTPATNNFQDLWWNAGGTESGWGVNVTHQGDTLFVTWFTYDANGNGMWLVGSNVNKVGPNQYSGTLYRTTGPAFDSASWDPSRVAATAVGTATFSFADGDNGTFTADVGGVSIAKPIVRQAFATPATTCH